MESIKQLHDYILSLDPTEILAYISTYDDFNQLVNLKLYLDDIYYNSDKESEFSDLQYDILKDYILSKKPDIVKVGAKIRDGRSKVKLPHYLGGADKITTNAELVKFMNSSVCIKAKQFVVSAKLDGVSALVVVDENKNVNIYKRGDETEGSDISYMADIFHFRKDIPLTVRGELIMSKKNFEKYKKGEKEVGHINDKYRSARGAVASVTNSDDAKLALKDIEFIPYEDILKNDELPSKSIKNLTKYGFKKINYKIVERESLTYDFLLNYLKELRKDYEFEVDGVIIQPDLPYDHISSGNPDYFVAFKHNFEEDNRETTVTNIEWNLSHHGKLIPVVHFEPVIIDNVRITQATGFNAKYIVNNSLNTGSKIVVIRSKQVIPYILKITKRSETPAKPLVPFEWDENETHYCAVFKKGDKNDEHCIQVIANFFEKMKCDSLGEGNVKKIYVNQVKKSGDPPSLMWFLTAEANDFIGDGVKSTLANKIKTSIEKCLQDIKFSTLFHATNIFPGMGETLLESLFPTPNEITTVNDLPELLLIGKGYKKDRDNMWSKAYMYVLQHPNMGEKRARIIADNLDTAYDFFKVCNKKN